MRSAVRTWKRAHDRRRRILGKVFTIESGEFELRPASGPTWDAVEVKLLETSVLESNPFFASLDQVHRHFQRSGM